MRKFNISIFTCLLFCLAGWQQVSGQCSGELLISSMMEGSSNNKCIELYNTSAASIDLSTYMINWYSNGSATVTGGEAIVGTIGAGEYFLVCHPSLDPSFGIIADFSVAGFLGFNGDDAIAITGPTGNSDVFGQIGVDPGSAWTGATSGFATNEATWCRTDLSACNDGMAAFDPDAQYATTGTQNDVSCLNSGASDACVITGSGLEVSTCNPDDDTFTITIDPVAVLGDAAGYTYTLNAGAVVGPIAYGTPTVFGPFAADGTTTYDIIITDNGDPACSMTIPTQTAPAPCLGMGGCSGELLISGMMEGSSNNKCIELYNTTAAAIDLSTYTINWYSNGSATVTGGEALMGTIGAGEYFLVCHPSLDPSFGIIPDFSVGGFLGFNGDDAIAIAAPTGNSDVFGQIGVDPGSAWTGSTSGFNTNEATWCRTDLTTCNDGMSTFDPDAQYASAGIQNDAACLNSGTSDVCIIGGSGLQVSPCSSADDTFTITIDPTATLGDAAGYTYEVNSGGAVGPIAYGTPTVLGPFTADGATTYDIVVIDNADSACMLAIPTITAPAACSTTGGCQGDLLISAYMEGSANNKCFELFNASAGMIDLSLYSFDRYSNGGTTPASEALTGMLAPGAYYLVCNTSTSTSLIIPDQYSTQVNFNGDDAFAISGPNGTEDTFGQIGFDPGSSWTGSTSACETANNSWSGKTACSDGTAAFDPDADYTCGSGSDDISVFNSGTIPVCSIDDAALLVSDCNANDDTFTISITPTATNGAATGYSVSVNGSADAVVFAYGDLNDLGTFTADGTTTYDIVITDENNTSCTLTIPTITAPAACSTADCDSDAGNYPWDGN